MEKTREKKIEIVLTNRKYSISFSTYNKCILSHANRWINSNCEYMISKMSSDRKKVRNEEENFQLFIEFTIQ
jgi:hypothetical protein